MVAATTTAARAARIPPGRRFESVIPAIPSSTGTSPAPGTTPSPTARASLSAESMARRSITKLVPGARVVKNREIAVASTPSSLTSSKLASPPGETVYTSGAMSAPSSTFSSLTAPFSPNPNSVGVDAPFSSSVKYMMASSCVPSVRWYSSGIVTSRPADVASRIVVALRKTSPSVIWRNP